MLHWRGEEPRATVIQLRALAGGLAGGPESGSVAEMFHVAGACNTFKQNAEIFAEGQPAEHLYKVVAGAARICRLMSDGRRHIGAFYLPGDVFGFEAGDLHSYCAEAVCDCTIRVVRKRRFLENAAEHPGAIAGLWEDTVRHLQRAHDHMFLLGRKNAQERIAAFLLDMADRLPNENGVELPMSRQDIADYLGLTIETVSRTLTQMERDRLLAMPVSRRIVLRNRSALVQMNDCMAA